MDRGRGEHLRGRGFHCGASIELLSQFASEEETLFPPNTMLKYMPRRRPSRASVAAAGTGVDNGDGERLAGEEVRTELQPEGGASAMARPPRRRYCEAPKT